MATPASNNRLRLTPSNSPFLSRSLRCTPRGRPPHESRLFLRRVIGTTCRSPPAFDSADSLFACTAGGSALVVDVDGQQCSQRFYRARPAAVPIYSVSTAQSTPSSPMVSTPKANDSRNRAGPGLRESPYSPVDWSDSPSSRTWTSRERIKAATCLALSPDGKYLAVGETGYAPRVLVFNLHDSSSDCPLVSISEHAFGVTAVAWSADSRYLASLGAANDGFLYVWKIDPRTGAPKLYQQNRCTSYVRAMVWVGSSLITLGVRHVKAWKVDEGSLTSPTKGRHANDTGSGTPTTAQKLLFGRNVLLGDLLESTFSCCAVVDARRLILSSDAGDVCTLDCDDRQPKLVKVLNIGFAITAMAIRHSTVHIGGKEGHFATLHLQSILETCPDSLLTTTMMPSGIAAIGFLTDALVTIDSRQSIDLWSPDFSAGQPGTAAVHVPIPGHGEPIAGLHALAQQNQLNAAFVTWSFSGSLTFWDLEGHVKASMQIPLDAAELDGEPDLVNQLTCVRITGDGRSIVTADRLGILKVLDTETKACLLDSKAHSSDCTCISLFEKDSALLMACSGRDRTAQLYRKRSDGMIAHFQTLEFAAKVVQVLVPSLERVITCSLDRTLQIHELVSKEGEPDILAALPIRVISLKASPSSMAVGQNRPVVYVSLQDRSVCQYDVSTGRQICCFKCTDEGGAEAAVLDCLSVGQWANKDVELLLGSSNTDKSIRLYEAANGVFLDREWGHTEAVNGVALIDDDDGSKKVVSAGSDGTIMIWALDLNDSTPSSISRDPSPVKEATAGRQTIRKILSKAELAEFQRPAASVGRRSPPRTIQRRSSRLNLTATSTSMRTPTGVLQASPGNSTINEDTPSRRRSSDESRADSPPPSPKSDLAKSPFVPALARKKSSSLNMRGFGSLNAATEQACRALRLYRNKLSSSEPITADMLSELDHELRLTAAALGNRAIRSKAISDTVLNGLLDQYSDKLVTLLDEKLRLGSQSKEREGENAGEECRRSSECTLSSMSS